MPTRRARAAPPAARPAPSDDAAVADRLHSAAIRLLRRLRRDDEHAGLSAPRLSALSVVVFGGPRTLGELAEAEQVRPPTMTRLVAALETEGLVTRAADPADGRVWRISATAKGRRVMARGRARRVATLAAAVGALSSDERDVLARATTIMETMLR